MKDLNCASCDKPLDTSGDCVVCSSCSASYHNIKECSGLLPTTWAAKSKSKKTKWVCVVCRNNKSLNSSSNTDLLDDLEADSEAMNERDKLLLNQMSNLLTKHFNQNNARLDKLEESVNFQSTQYDSINNKLAEALVSIRDVCEENRKIKEDYLCLVEKNKELQHKVEHLEAYSRINNIIISGLTPEKDSNPYEIALNICKFAEVTINYGDIDACHWLQPNNNTKTTSLIVKFVNWHIKETLVKNWRSKSVTADTFCGSRSSRVYISDHLTPSTSKLLKEAKKLKHRQQNKYKYIWTVNGRVLVRKDDTSKVIVVSNTDDLQNL